eukprot:s352_g22.t1
MSQQMYEDSQINKPAKRARIETLQLSDLLLDEPPQIDINDATMGISMVKPAKRARIETLQLSDLLLDEPPQIDINDATMGISMVRRLLEVHDNALALAGTAHLARLKAYSSKFLGLVSQRNQPPASHFGGATGR